MMVPKVFQVGSCEDSQRFSGWGLTLPLITGGVTLEEMGGGALCSEAEARLQALATTAD